MLERVGRGVILTDKGRLLAERGTRLLADLEEVRQPRGRRGRTSCAARCGSRRSRPPRRGLVAPLLARLARTAPGVWS